MPFTQQNPFSFNHIDQVDTPLNDATDIKAKWDSRAKEVRDAHNSLVTKLSSTVEGDSGADNIGATPYDDIASETVQGQLEEQNAKIDSQLPSPDGSLHDVKLGNDEGDIKQRFSAHLADNTYHETVADMKANSALAVGTTVYTHGYYSANDGGSACYIITDVSNTNYHQEALSNGLYANLVVTNNSLNVLQLGFNNDAINNATVLYHAFSLMINGGEIVLPVGTYNTNHVVIDFTFTHITLKSASMFGTTLSCLENEYCFTFNNSCTYFKVENLIINCNSIGNGFNFNSGSTSMQIRFTNVGVSNCHKGFRLMNVVYFFGDRLSASILSGANGDDFGLYIKGYEYNYFKNCSFQNNASSNFVNHDLVIIDSTSYINFDYCEFAKCGGAAIKLISDSGSTHHIKITNCVIYRVFYGLYMNMVNTYSRDIIFDNNLITLEGVSSAEVAVCAFNNNQPSGRTTVNLKISNLHVERFGAVSGTSILFNDNTVLNVSITNLSSFFTTASACSFGNNAIDTLSFNTKEQSRGSVTITGDGSKTDFDIILPVNTIPIMASNIPQIQLNPITLQNYYFQVSQALFASSSLRNKVSFKTAPPTGTHTIEYKVRY